MGFSIKNALRLAKFGIRAGKVVLDKADETVEDLKKEYEDHGPKEDQKDKGDH